MFKFKFTTRNLTGLALLLAMEIVLSRFLSVNAWNIKIGFSFLPVAVAAILYGPLAAAVVAALADFLGAILFPVGPYFPGFTLTAFLTGLVFGLFLHRKQNLPRILSAVAVNQLILSLFLNTFWISVLYDSPFGPLLATRVVQTMILVLIQVPCIHAVSRLLTRYGKKVFAL